jgi:glycosyltransferase involved in cell wall biosynthesis
MENKNNWPRITVVTPSFNQGKFLEETIQSVLNQNYPNLEYFIVDGGSTDNSVDIIKKYAEKLDWWVSEPDTGQSNALNKGLLRATGEILNWINSDDLFFPDALTNIAKSFITHPEADIFVGDHAWISSAGKIIKYSGPPCRYAISINGFIIPIGQQSTFFSKRMFESIGGWVREDLHAIMDADLYYRLFKAGAKLVRVKALVGAIRNHPEAKGCARKDLWSTERPKYLQQIGVSSLDIKLSLVKMRFVRIMDGSYLRSLTLQRLYSGKTITGKGWSDIK